MKPDDPMSIAHRAEPTQSIPTTPQQGRSDRRFLNPYHTGANTALCAGVFGGIVSQLTGAMPAWAGFLAADAVVTVVVALSITLNER